MTDFSLFNSWEEELFSQKLKTLNRAEMEELFHSRIFAKGHAYYYSNQIESVQFQPGQVDAKIIGNKLYETAITRKGDQVFGLCSCPTGGPCKHLAALLIHLVNDAEDKEREELDVSISAASAAEKAFEDHVNNLTLDELRQLVLQFAPESFRQSILTP